MDIDKEYLVLQTNYHQVNFNNPEAFSEEWYNIQEYDLKKDILRECLHKNIVIKESSLYPKFRLMALNGERNGRN